MNIRAIIEHVLRGESTLVEAKLVSLDGDRLSPHPESLARTLAAFANARGGQLVLGVDSERQIIDGIKRDQLQGILQKLDGILVDTIKPPLYFSAVDHGQVVDSDGVEHTIVVVDVPKSLFVHEVKGKTVIRVGTSTRELSGDARSRLEMQRSHSKLLHFDEMPIPGCKLSDLSPALVESLLTSARVSDLRALRLVSQVFDLVQPVVGAVLLLTAEPFRWLRGAYIQAEIFRGRDKDPSQQVDAQRFEGPLDQQLIDCWKFCKRYTRVRMIKDPARLDIPEYDEVALFEAIANAVVHRDYSITGSPIMVSMYDDRIEIVSPGGLPNTMTLESMRTLPMPRNELLVGLLSRYYRTRLLGAERHLVEGRLFGVQQILDRSTALSGRTPLYQLRDEPPMVGLTIYAAPGPERDP